MEEAPYFSSLPEVLVVSVSTVGVGAPLDWPPLDGRPCGGGSGCRSEASSSRNCSCSEPLVVGLWGTLVLDIARHPSSCH